MPTSFIQKVAIRRAMPKRTGLPQKRELMNWKAMTSRRPLPPGVSRRQMGPAVISIRKRGPAPVSDGPEGWAGFSPRNS